MKRSKVSKAFQKIRKNIPLKIRLQVAIQMQFIDLITELGYRENKGWTDDEQEVLNTIYDSSVDLAEDQMKTYDEWEQDGNP